MRSDIGEVLTAGAAFVGTLLIGVACAAPAVAAPAMSRATVEPGVELEYRVQGSGEPVVLLHAGMFADWFRPLLDEAALTARYRVLSLHRVGYAGSSRVAGPVSIARQASQVRELMRQLGMTRAHIVGHSSGGNIALQLALDAPQQVHSLALLEPALPVGSTRRAHAFDATVGDGVDHRQLAQRRQGGCDGRLHAHGVGTGVPRGVRPSAAGYLRARRGGRRHLLQPGAASDSAVATHARGRRRASSSPCSP